jgi:hypothetical protein
MTSAATAQSRWVISFLVTDDEAGIMAVSAEGLVKTTLWGHPDGSQPIASTVARFAELSAADQDDRRRLLEQEAAEG